MRRETIEGAVVVITGASSGLGRATAHGFAERGARLVLAAREPHPLQEVAGECDRLGGFAITRTADVGEPRDLIELAREAVERLGGIDVWINNAGTGAVGDFLDTPLPAHEQVVRTNLMGALYGAYAALPVFESQGHGTLINVNSVGAWSAAPYAAAYGASKAGLLGLTRALRAEYSDWRDIHVCGIYPTFLDTPGLFHGANYTGRALGIPPGSWDADRIAERIVALAERPHAADLPGALSKMSRLADFAAPKLAGSLAARGMRAYLRRAEDAPQSDGALFEPAERTRRVHAGPAREESRTAALALLTIGAVAGGALLMRALRDR